MINKFEYPIPCANNLFLINRCNMRSYIVPNLTIKEFDDKVLSGEIEVTEEEAEFFGLGHKFKLYSGKFLDENVIEVAHI